MAGCGIHLWRPAADPSCEPIRGAAYSHRRSCAVHLFCCLYFPHRRLAMTRVPAVRTQCSYITAAGISANMGHNWLYVTDIRGKIEPAAFCFL
ncbi:hypothetical protein GDO78_016005 [Eleutherodactylus coqui]|uniref:Uncharacterized protein n=1 Tax=Eleutherodactylus coqui TaxID=57060 RepID=A0A8J6E6E0_ELECQ|nr:hypothetical protein GDO78_016005 [Eleutherodactylus coqui]